MLVNITVVIMSQQRRAMGTSKMIASTKAIGALKTNATKKMKQQTNDSTE